LTRFQKMAQMGLLAMTLLTVFAVEAFLKRPGNLALHSSFPIIFARAFAWFAQFHVVLCVLASASVFVPYLTTGKNRLTFFLGAVSTVLIAFTAELGGTSIGIPFGKYEYAELLGYKIAGHVPFLIPMSWFAIASLSYSIGSKVWAGRSLFAKLATSAILITLWDLSLDPAMSHAFSYWTWQDRSEFFYGMSSLNIPGWLLTSGLISWALHGVGFDRLSEKVQLKPLLVTYVLLISLGLLVCFTYGMGRALLASLVAYALLFAVVALKGGVRRAPKAVFEA
jgi:uncharacterized membrane protein